MTGSRHHIRKQTLRVELESEAQALVLQPRLSDFNRKRLLAIIEQVFDSVDVPGLHLRIDRLDVDLGTVPLDNFEQVVEERLTERLREVVEQAVHARRVAPAEGEQPRTEAEVRLELLEHYLLHGTLPYWAPRGAGFSFGALFAEVARSDPEALVVLVGRHASMGRVIDRLVLQLDQRSLERLITLLEPKHAALLIDYIISLQALHRVEPVLPLSERGLSRLLWSLTLTYLVKEAGSQFNRKSALKQLLEGVAESQGLEYPELLTTLGIGLDQVRKRHPVLASLSFVIGELVRELPPPVKDVVEVAEHDAVEELTVPETASARYELTEALRYYLQHGVLPWGTLVRMPELTAERVVATLPELPRSLQRRALAWEQPGGSLTRLVRAVRRIPEEILAKLLVRLMPRSGDEGSPLRSALPVFVARAEDKPLFFARLISALLDGRPVDLEELAAPRAGAFAETRNTPESDLSRWEAHALKSALVSRLRFGTRTGPTVAELLAALLASFPEDTRHFLLALRDVEALRTELVEQSEPELLERAMDLLRPRESGAMSALLHALNALPERVLPRGREGARQEVFHELLLLGETAPLSQGSFSRLLTRLFGSVLPDEVHGFLLRTAVAWEAAGQLPAKQVQAFRGSIEELVPRTPGAVKASQPDDVDAARAGDVRRVVERTASVSRERVSIEALSETARDEQRPDTGVVRARQETTGDDSADEVTSPEVQRRSRGPGRETDSTRSMTVGSEGRSAPPPTFDEDEPLAFSAGGARHARATDVDEPLLPIIAQAKMSPEGTPHARASGVAESVPGEREIDRSSPGRLPSEAGDVVRADSSPANLGTAQHVEEKAESAPLKKTGAVPDLSSTVNHEPPSTSEVTKVFASPTISADAALAESSTSGIQSPSTHEAEAEHIPPRHAYVVAEPPTKGLKPPRVHEATEATAASPTTPAVLVESEPASREPPPTNESTAAVAPPEQAKAAPVEPSLARVGHPRVLDADAVLVPQSRKDAPRTEFPLTSIPVSPASEANATLLSPTAGAFPHEPPSTRLGRPRTTEADSVAPLPTESDAGTAQPPSASLGRPRDSEVASASTTPKAADAGMAQPPPASLHPSREAVPSRTSTQPDTRTDGFIPAPSQGFEHRHSVEDARSQRPATPDAINARALREGSSRIPDSTHASAPHEGSSSIADAPIPSSLPPIVSPEAGASQRSAPPSSRIADATNASAPREDSSLISDATSASAQRDGSSLIPDETSASAPREVSDLIPDETSASRDGSSGRLDATTASAPRDDRLDSTNTSAPRDDSIRGLDTTNTSAPRDDSIRGLGATNTSAPRDGSSRRPDSTGASAPRDGSGLISDATTASAPRDGSSHRLDATNTRALREGSGLMSDATTASAQRDGSSRIPDATTASAPREGSNRSLDATGASAPREGSNRSLDATGASAPREGSSRRLDATGASAPREDSSPTSDAPLPISRSSPASHEAGAPQRSPSPLTREPPSESSSAPGREPLAPRDTSRTQNSNSAPEPLDRRDSSSPDEVAPLDAKAQPRPSRPTNIQGHDAREALFSFLLAESADRYAGLSDDALLRLLQSLLDESPEVLHGFVRRHAHRKRLQEHWARNLPDSVLSRFSAVLAPHVHAALLSATEVLVAAWQEVAPPGTPALTERSAFWRFVLELLGERPGGSLTLEQLVAAFFEHFSARLHTAQPGHRDPRNTAERLLERAIELAQHEAVPRLAALLRQRRDALVTTWTTTTRPDSRRSNTSRSRPANPSKDSRRTAFRLSEEKHGGTPIYIDNAGLVLVSPFIPHLFRELGLSRVDDAGKTHLDPEPATRAVHLLQYLVDGRTSAPEPLLVLNKIFCGLSIPTPVPSGIDLTEREQSLCDRLLKALIANWTTIANTSVAGLRETFFQREGRLEQLDDRWKLQVQRKTLDVLVDQVPWSISILTHPWMPQPLYVSW
ncbi:hypothetical protein FJV41_21100 [Myxococcus llanfairpwllgwyngyllgogerychwyrndrobwllllantysiliogogogochensis]|uniref:Uncharacterized protein n=1 Tax=Myxococcus llanfairpwllgwyngyllgogerychwyrndrobwllllantysiliogogogochensis TaxID=2590453 RepID=A0A540WY82_9BACT|nr:contractile injection system tape measure protein [Myxococcus llanfairpwllgwyngyllgogerychwyrndrobwllllantysiliogogogochensis]TQF13969.1 hypothetical protein FJV41_21100 [Myxococcus llanfairpwllgwyngyllgogerychwyrndrobwllllantysiliogogogochensis]